MSAYLLIFFSQFHVESLKLQLCLCLPCYRYINLPTHFKPIDVPTLKVHDDCCWKGYFAIIQNLGFEFFFCTYINEKLYSMRGQQVTNQLACRDNGL